MSSPYLSVSWPEYHALALQLATSIRKAEQPIDIIVAVARGGLTPGHLLADFLKTPICSITIQSYTDIKKQGEVAITAGLNRRISGKRILLVDDIADTGKTLKRAAAYLKQFQPKATVIATLFLKPHSEIHPDFFALKTSKWILQPFEATEWITAFTKKLKSEHRSKKEIAQFLTSLGYTDSQMAFVNKFYPT